MYLKKNRKNKRRALIILFVAISIMPAIPVMAHKAVLFAWLEGNTVHTESNLSGGKTLNIGKIIVYKILR